MKKLFKRKIMSFVVIVSLISSISLNAFAMGTTSEGSYTTVYVNGYTLKYNSTVTADTGSVWSHVHIYNPKYENLPVGYLGVNARMYNSSGTLIKSSGWEYNDTPLLGIANMTPIYYTSAGTYYGRGQVRVYNGNGYNIYTTTRSPYIQAHSLKNLEINVNENNEIYGSEYFLEQYDIHPDLISAIGDNGNEGYVKATDLEEPEPNSLADAVKYQKNLQSERKINLYENDGITVIGTYTVEYNHTTYEVAE